MKAKLITVSSMTLTALLVAWGVFLAFDWASEYVATEQSPAYQELPFEFRLKANPEDVIFSEAFATSDGRDIVKYAYLGTEVSPQLNEDISRRTPNSYTEVIGKSEDEEGKHIETLKTTFFSKPSFYEKEGKWKSIEYATTTPEVFSMSGAIPHIKKRELVERLLPGLSVFAATATYYPQPNVETESVDGYIDTYFGWDTGGAAVWTVAHDCDTGTGAIISADDSATSLLVSRVTTRTGVNPEFTWDTQLKRAVLLFNTAALPDTASIDSATLSFYATAKSGSGSVTTVSVAPASNLAVATGDCTSFGTTKFATDLDLTSITTSAFNGITLNSSGLANISKTSVSKFALIEERDFANTWPGNNTSASVDMASADSANDPRLEVTYDSPLFSIGMWFPF